MSKKVMIYVSVHMDVEVPEDWDKKMIEFYYNDSSYCASNLIEDMHAVNEQRDKEGSCMCDLVSVKYVADA